MLIFLNGLFEMSFKGYLACWTQIKLEKKSFFGMKIHMVKFKPSSNTMEMDF
jgi:hypothetical protein